MVWDSPRISTKKSKDELLKMLAVPTSERQFVMYEALRKGATVDELFELTKIKHYFIEQMKELVEEEDITNATGADASRRSPLTQAKDSFSDKYLAKAFGAAGAGDPQPPFGDRRERSLGRRPCQRH